METNRPSPIREELWDKQTPEDKAKFAALWDEVQEVQDTGGMFNDLYRLTLDDKTFIVEVATGASGVRHTIWHDLEEMKDYSQMYIDQMTKQARAVSKGEAQ